MMMKYSMDGAMAQVLQRGEKLRQEKRGLAIRRLAEASLLAGLLLAAFFCELPVVTPVAEPGMTCYGASLIPAEMGGYVLVGVLTFCAAVAITVLCIKLREKKK